MEIVGLYYVVDEGNILLERQIFKVYYTDSDEDYKMSQSLVNKCKKYAVKEFIKWLEESNILYFFPYQDITIDWDDTKTYPNISLAYYQNNVIYKMATSELDNEIYMRPNMIIMSRLFSHYDSYAIEYDEIGNIQSD